eukprot:TRINITY_DN76689_c0_g1_i1.p2 TRINITY_DN76689_c0_g1~~TRINITY_DN76689_c0_g1_i1.p2  ORF type:complete len:107 (+),score=5.03 TRINITY_DN76689_c0_g1_i1:331-651(+)
MRSSDCNDVEPTKHSKKLQHRSITYVVFAKKHTYVAKSVGLRILLIPLFLIFAITTKTAVQTNTSFPSIDSAAAAEESLGKSCKQDIPGSLRKQSTLCRDSVELLG